MQNTNKKKICIVVSSLGRGGAERSSALLSVMLNNLGHEVHIISVLNYIEYDFKGILLNLGELKDKDDSVFGRFKRFLVFRSYVKKHNFDVIIDNRTRSPIFREIFISLCIYNLAKTIFVVRSFKLEKYFPKNRFIAKQLYRKSAKMVGVSKEIISEIKNLYQLDNSTCIYNPKPNLIESSLQTPTNYILAYGRLKDEVKNFSFLIKSYAKSKLPSEEVKLLILGDGEDKDKLKSLVKQMDLTDKVLFKGFEENPYSFIKNAKYVCLTSKFEGFPRVLIESLSIGTPVVSVNCKSGPKEIIQHGVNGLLVENYETEEFANAMNSFIFDETLYKICKSNAQNSITHLSLETIAQEWDKLINTI